MTLIRTAIFFAAAASAFLASCSSGGGSHEVGTAVESVRSTPPQIAVTVKPPPSQDPAGSKLVLFDPCRSVGDDVVARAGFDPATRERDDQIHTGYAFISCGFSHSEIVDGQKVRAGNLSIASSNITLDQFRQREGPNATTITVNGAEAITFNSEVKGCNVVLRGPDNSLDITVYNSALAEWHPCDHVQEIASVIDAAVNGSK